MRVVVCCSLLSVVINCLSMFDGVFCCMCVVFVVCLLMIDVVCCYGVYFVFVGRCVAIVVIVLCVVVLCVLLLVCF